MLYKTLFFEVIFMSNKSFPASTMTPSSITGQQLDVKVTRTDMLDISGNDVNHITNDPETNSTKSLPTSYALSRLKDLIYGEFTDVKQLVHKIFFSPVLSDPIINPFFIDVGWYLQNFYVDRTQLVYSNQTGTVGVQAKARVLSPNFIYPGKYFIYLQVSELTSGNLTIVNEKQETILTIDRRGTYTVETEISQPTIAILDFDLSGLNEGETCRIDYISIHYVKTAFSVYLDHLVEKIGSGGSGFVTGQELLEAIGECLNDARTYTDSQINFSSEEFDLHLSDRASNPHGITPAMIDAASKNHSHPWTDISDTEELDVRFDQINEQIVQAVAQIVTHVSEENPHGITAGSIGAADIVHEHTVSDISDFHLVDNKFAQVQLSVDTLQTTFASLYDEFQLHLAVYNPHGITAETVGLEQLVNAPMATSQEAMDGSLTERYINPQGLHHVLSAYTSVPEFSVAKVRPKIYGQFTFDQFSEVAYAIEPDKIYKLQVDSDNAEILKKLRIVINTKDDVDNHYRNAIIAPYTVTIDETQLKVMTVQKSSKNHFIIVPEDMGINSGTAHLELNTSTMTLTGQVVGRVLDAGEEILNEVYPIQIQSGFSRNNIPVPQILRMYIADGELGDLKVTIFEFVEESEEPALLVDANPIGMQVQFYGTELIPGYLRLDGSELPRSHYPELYRFLTENDLLVSDVEWHFELGEGDTCRSFSSGDGTLTFRVPKIPQDSTTKLTWYIKAKPVQVPDDTGILYRYIWD
jgi:hypothetical protein